MKYAIYLIRSLKNSKFYTGISKNPLQRLKEHNSGKLKTTSVWRPFELVWVKFYGSASGARKHEKWLKKKSVGYKNRLAEVAQLAPPV